MIGVKQLDKNCLTDIKELLQELVNRTPKNIDHIVDKEIVIAPTSGDDGDYKNLPDHVDVVFDDGSEGKLHVKNENWTKGGFHGTSMSAYFNFDENTREAELEFSADIPPGIYDQKALNPGKMRFYMSRAVLDSTCSIKTRAFVEKICDKDFDCEKITSAEGLATLYKNSTETIEKLQSLKMPYVTKLSGIAEGSRNTLVETGEIIPRSDGAPIDFSQMFYGCQKLTTVGKIHTENGTNFRDMFCSCYALQNIDWAIDLSHAKNIAGMFYGCKTLADDGIHLKNVPRSLDLSKIGIAAGKYVIDNYID